MIRTIIIEDEQDARDHIKLLIASNCPDVEIVGEAHNVKSGIEIINKKKPKLVLMDILLPDGTGFDLLNSLENINFNIIFVTAYREYAVEAFKFSAIHYLLKPIVPDDLISAVKKANDRLISQNVETRLKSLFYNLQSNTNGSKKVVLTTGTNLYVVHSEEIVMCKSEKSHTEFYVADGRVITVFKAIKDFDDLLSGYGFFRVHKQFLININHITSFDKTGAGQVHMTGDHVIPVSFRKREQLLELFINL